MSAPAPTDRGSLHSAAGRRVRLVMVAAAVVVGVVLVAVAVRDIVVWHGRRDDAADAMRLVEAERARVQGSTPALDAAAQDALDRLTGDDLLATGLALFAAGSLAVGAGVGAALGRVRRRQARVALHPSLVAAADRKLERLLAEHAQDLVTMLDDDGRFTYVSPSVGSILGYEPGELIGKRFELYFDAPSLAGPAASGDERRSGEPLRHRARHAGGEVRWLETLSHRIEDDRAVGVVTIYSSRDVTERVRLEETLVAERRLLGDTLANIHAGILSVDIDGHVIDANAELCAMVAFRPATGEAVASVESRYGLIDEAGREVTPADRPLARAAAGESVKQFAATLVAADGSRRDVMATAGPLVGADGRRNGALLTLHDVSELRAAEAELRSLATVDVLTGLPNRRHLLAALTEAMARNVDAPERIALLFLDLDGFKDVNDTYGHDVGDEVLKQVAQRIEACLRGHDIVARLGGDEFVVLVEQLQAPTDIVPLVARLEGALSEPFELRVGADRLVAGSPGDAVSVAIGASVGVALGGQLSTPGELLARADAAMYERKRAGRARHAALISGPG